MILSVDCGSTNLKAALFDETLRRLAQSSCTAPHVLPSTHGWVEMDPEAFWQATLALVRDTCGRAGVHPSQVTRVAITSQAQTFTLLDERFMPLTPLISWLDRRAEREAAQLAHVFSDEFALHCSFTRPVAELQAAKLAWINHANPGLLKRARLVASLPAWLGFRLGAAAVVDDNLAAMSGLYSLQTGGYWQPMLDLCGARPDQLPEVQKVGTSVPLVTPCSDLQLAPGAIMTLAGNDQTSGAVGCGCRTDTWLATLGTALVAYRLAGSAAGPYHLDGCWGPYLGGGYYELAVQSYGCAALDWANGLLFSGQSLDTFFTAAQAAAKQDWPGSLFFYPDRAGSTDAWAGPDFSLAEKSLAVLYGISFTLRRLLYDGLGAGPEMQQLLVTGGGSRSDFWLGLLADILNIPIQRASGDSLLGAARMAFPEVDPPVENSAPARWMPDSRKVRFYQELYQQWLNH